MVIYKTNLLDSPQFKSKAVKLLGKSTKNNSQAYNMEGRKHVMNAFTNGQLPSISKSNLKAKSQNNLSKIKEKSSSLIKKEKKPQNNSNLSQTLSSNVNYNFNVNSIQINNQNCEPKNEKSSIILDNRKFSILDIPSGINPNQEQIIGLKGLIPIQTLSNISLNNNNGKQNARSFAFGDFQNMSNSSKEASYAKASLKINLNLGFLKFNNLKCFYLMLESDFLIPQKRLSLSLSIKPIYNISKPFLLKNFIKGLAHQITHFDQKYKSIPSIIDDLKKWQPQLSMTTQFALNHLTRSSENILSNLRHNQKEVDLMFKALFILFNINEQSNFENSLISLYSQYKVDNLSMQNILYYIESLLLERSPGVIKTLTKKQIFSILKLFYENEGLLRPSQLFSFGKEVSSLSFFLKDLNAYLSKQIEGRFLYNIKFDYQRKCCLISKMNNLKKLMRGSAGL